jgi:NAD(P)-dependent dehydrogenase (short-subunit alcohol dehydrogenase family)
MGLGWAIAQGLVRSDRNVHVIITARNLSIAKGFADRLVRDGYSASAKKLDVTSDMDCEQVFSEIKSEFGRLDGLVNNAGAFFDEGGDPLVVDFDFVKDALDTNLLGAWRVSIGAYPLLKLGNFPRIVNVSSGAGSYTDPVFGITHHKLGVPVYAITKLALNGLTQKLALRLKPEGILVNAVCPGWIATFPGMEELGARPVSEGAEGVIWALNLPEDGPTGGFFRNKKPLEW